MTGRIRLSGKTPQIVKPSRRYWSLALSETERESKGYTIFRFNSTRNTLSVSAVR